jgi:hypothetical protein
MKAGPSNRLRGPKPFAHEQQGIIAKSDVPAVYLKVAFCPFLSFLPFRRINKLRVVNKRTGFESHPLRQSFRMSGLEAILKSS